MYYLQNAVMSFEEEKVSHSMETLRNMERRCGGGENGWFSSVKSIVMGSKNGQDQVCYLFIHGLLFLQISNSNRYKMKLWILFKCVRARPPPPFHLIFSQLKCIVSFRMKNLDHT